MDGNSSSQRTDNQKKMGFALLGTHYCLKCPSIIIYNFLHLVLCNAMQTLFSRFILFD